VHLAAPKYRTNFSINDFANLYKLNLVGATFFYSSWDVAQARGTDATIATVRLHDTLTYAQSMLEKTNLLKKLVLEGSVHFAVPLSLTFNGEALSAGILHGGDCGCGLSLHSPAHGPHRAFDAQDEHSRVGG